MKILGIYYLIVWVWFNVFLIHFFKFHGKVGLTDILSWKVLFAPVTVAGQQASTELGFNGKVRIPLGSFQIESEGLGKFPELVPIELLHIF